MEGKLKMLFPFPVVLVTSAVQRTHFAGVSCSVSANISVRERLMQSDFLLVSACLCAGDAAREEELCFFFLHRTEDTGTMYFDPSGSEASGQIQRSDQNTAAAII